MQHFQAIALFAFLSIITPGPNNLMIMTSSMNFGVRKSLPHFFGIIVGFPLMLLAMGLGLNAVFESLPWFHTALLVFSLLMMVYLAWRIASFSPSADALKPGAKPLSFFNAVLFQWVNPKAWFMATAAVALFPARLEYACTGRIDGGRDHGQCGFVVRGIVACVGCTLAGLD